MATERLTPLPHLLKSIRSRNWSLGGALMEWVDNSLQHGRADNIAIMIDNAFGIAIKDNGIGIDDINRVFTLGDASAYGDLSQIGQYGVGATDAMIYLGEVAAVETVRDGRKHAMKCELDPG
jgi:anti-sigma regulatory factor (Ser/Thr protein kinase)